MSDDVIAGKMDHEELERANLREYQSECWMWAQENFPGGQAHHPLLGVSEEVGELCHAHLKMEQGIRGDKKELRAKQADAVGDIIIYLLDYCSRNNLCAQTCLATAWEHVRDRNWNKNKKDGTTNG